MTLKLQRKIQTLQKTLTLVVDVFFVLSERRKMNIAINDEFSVVTIEKGKAVLSDNEPNNQYVRDMIQSMSKNKILCDKVCGAEKVQGEYCMVVFHGPYKVRIPFERSGIILPDSNNNYGRKELIRRVIEGRIGSDIEYAVTNFVIGEPVSLGDREFAMNKRRDEFFSKTRSDGSFLLDKDVIAEVRILHTAPRSLTVELFGKEIVISSGLLKPWPVYDARKYFHNGDTAFVKITDISRTDGNISVSVSAKDALDYDMGKIVETYEKNAIYIGVVVWASNNKYMVCLNDNIGCLCSKRRNNFPLPGQTVIVKVIGVSKAENKIWGTIMDVAG